MVFDFVEGNCIWRILLHTLQRDTGCLRGHNHAGCKNDVNSTEQYARESIRVARCARELLKRFATAYRELSDADHGPSAVEMMSSMEFTSNRAGVFTDDDIHDQIEISKELFLVVIQDRGLDIKPSFSW